MGATLPPQVRAATMKCGWPVSEKGICSWGGRFILLGCAESRSRTSLFDASRCTPNTRRRPIDNYTGHQTCAIQSRTTESDSASWIRLDCKVSRLYWCARNSRSSIRTCRPVAGMNTSVRGPIQVGIKPTLPLNIRGTYRYQYVDADCASWSLRSVFHGLYTWRIVAAV